MNNIQKMFALMSMLLIGSLPASVPCGSVTPGVLNVGILPDNLPYSSFNGTQVSGFDPLFVEQIAKLLGYNSVNFISFPTDFAALEALQNGTIDLYANSATNFSASALSNYFGQGPFIGVVTDISQSSNSASANGYLVNISCCALALQMEAAITQLVNNGVYAQVLQTMRADGITGIFGFPSTVGGVLLEPAPFNSSEIGTIPAACQGTGPITPVVLPRTNCISAFVQANFVPSTTVTGVTGRLIG